ncbi:MAG TPA: efflux RND transporter periplasmic adaptor subunit [Candidatus Obscuribacterales bacterium]
MDRRITDSVDKHDVASQGEHVRRPLHPAYFVVPIIAIAALVVIGAVPRLIQKQTLIKEGQATQRQTLSVSYVVARASAPLEEFTLPGNTEAIQHAPIYARVDGYLHQRFVDIGDIVHKGQVIATIETPELDKQVETATNAIAQSKANLENSRQSLSKAQADEHTAAANVRKAKADVDYYKVELARYRQLAGQGAVSLEDHDTRLQQYNDGMAALDAAQEAQQSAQATIRSAEAGVHVAEAALQAATSQRGQYAASRSFQKVQALFDGIVTKRNVDAGALVSSGSSTSNTVLFEIAQIDLLRIYAYVPEQLVPDVRAGQKAKLIFQAYPKESFEGTVTNIAGGLDPTSKTLQVELHVPNSSHRLLPGMYCQVKFQEHSADTLTVVPSTAVQTRASGVYVYTIDSSNHVHRHSADIQRDLGGHVELANAVAPGDKVIISPSDDVVDGIAVNPVLAPADKSSSAI